MDFPLILLLEIVNIIYKSNLEDSESQRKEDRWTRDLSTQRITPCSYLQFFFFIYPRLGAEGANNPDSQKDRLKMSQQNSALSNQKRKVWKIKKGLDHNCSIPINTIEKTVMSPQPLPRKAEQSREPESHTRQVGKEVPYPPPQPLPP